MFSLVVVIISILLVSALALVVMFYGGSSMTEGASKAEAVKIMNQGSQIMGAADLYKSDTGSWPPSLEALVSERYLKTIPVGTEGDLWDMPKPGAPTFVLKSVRKEPCKAVNLISQNTDGIFDKLSSTYNAQCYAPAAETFYVVFTKEGQGLTVTGSCPAGTTAEGLPGLGSVICKPVPKDCDDPGWAVKPSYCDGGGPGPVDPKPPVPQDGGLVASPKSLTFEDTLVGEWAAEKVVRITNTGVNPEQVYYTTNDSAQFTFYSECDSGLLSPGDFCDIYFYFNPAAEGLQTDSAAVGNEGPALRIGMTGRGVEEEAAAAPLAIEYLGKNYATTTKNGQTLAGSPTLRVNDTYDYFDQWEATRPLAPRVFTLKNKGTESLSLGGVSLPDYVEGQIEAQYSVSNGCGATLAAGASCNITVNPQGVYAGYVSGEGNLFSGEYQLEMPLSVSYSVGADNYTGKVNGFIKWMPEFTVTDGFNEFQWFDFRLDAPSDVVGSSIKKMIVVTNNSLQDLPVVFTQTRGQMTATPSTGCAGKAPAGKKCFYEIGYKRIINDIVPQWISSSMVEGTLDLQIGNRTGEVSISTVTTGLTITPMEVNWGPQPLGQTMSKVYQVRNNSRVDIKITSVEWALSNGVGDPNHEQSISNDSCTGILAPGETCKFTTHNKPTSLPAGYQAGRTIWGSVLVNIEGWEKGYTPYKSPDSLTVMWSLVASGPEGPSTDTEGNARAMNYVQQGGPNLYEVPVTVQPYTDGCSGDATAFNTCARGRLEQALNMSCQVFRVETSWSTPDTYQSRISCRK